MKNTRLSIVVATLLYVVLVFWWVALHFIVKDATDSQKEIFSGVYGVMALCGAFIGLRAAKMWGFGKSTMGRAIIFFALGLFAQEFGQVAYSLYTLILHQEIPYPSIGDLGYFGSVLLYIYGAFLLGKVVVARINNGSVLSKIYVLVLPVLLLAFTYSMFLREYAYDGSPLRAFLDFGYPFGQAIYLVIALLVYIRSNKYLGGIMRSTVLLLLFALGVQYFADFSFLYQTQHETWVTAGTNDLTYLTSYFVMSFALYKFMSTAKKLSGENSSE